MTDTLDKSQLTNYLEKRITTLENLAIVNLSFNRDFNIKKEEINDLLLKVYAGEFDC